MCRIKVCGIQRLEDVDILNRFLPEYAGFIFAESKRRVDIEKAKCLIRNLAKSIRPAGVFVNADLNMVKHTVEQCGLNVIQLHGEETTDYMENVKKFLPSVEIWKAIRVEGLESLKKLEEKSADAFLLDTYSKEAYGGTGKTFDWEIASRLSQKYKIILAGGLNSRNAARAIDTVRPFCLDVSSGVETDGYKDEEKIRDFVYAVRAY